MARWVMGVPGHECCPSTTVVLPLHYPGTYTTPGGTRWAMDAPTCAIVHITAALPTSIHSVVTLSSTLVLPAFAAVVQRDVDALLTDRVIAWVGAIALAAAVIVIAARIAGAQALVGIAVAVRGS